MATPDHQKVSPELLRPRLRSDRWRPSWRRPGLANRTTLKGTLSTDPVQNDNELSNATQKILHLEKNILFLSERHKDMLEQLHKEIERLKVENRELTFKLVMCRCSNGNSRESDRCGLKEEIQTLRASLTQERRKSRQLKTLIERRVLEQQRSLDQLDNDSTMGVGHTSRVGMASRPLNLADSKTMIGHLQMVNRQQKHELQQIKADLRDVLYSHRWTPDAFLLARAYVADDEERGCNGDTLPKITPNPNMSNRAYRCVREEVTLPALKANTNTFPERQKRTQALRNKLGRSLPYE